MAIIDIAAIDIRLSRYQFPSSMIQGAWEASLLWDFGDSGAPNSSSKTPVEPLAAILSYTITQYQFKKFYILKISHPRFILKLLDKTTIHPAPVCSNSPLDQDSVSTREAGTQLAKVSSNNVLASDNLGSIGFQKEVGEIGESILQKTLGFWYDFILHVTLRVCWDCCLVKCLDQQIHSQSTIELPYFNGVDMVSGQDLPLWIQKKMYISTSYKLDRHIIYLIESNSWLGEFGPRDSSMVPLVVW